MAIQSRKRCICGRPILSTRNYRYPYAHIIPKEKEYQRKPDTPATQKEGT